MADAPTAQPPAAAGLEDAFEHALAWAPLVARRRGLPEDVVLGLWGDLLARLDPAAYAPPADAPPAPGAG